jgi:hypothetical protein
VEKINISANRQHLLAEFALRLSDYAPYEDLCDEYKATVFNIAYVVSAIVEGRVIKSEITENKTIEGVILAIDKANRPSNLFGV